MRFTLEYIHIRLGVVEMIADKYPCCTVYAHNSVLSVLWKQERKQAVLVTKHQNPSPTSL